MPATTSVDKDLLLEFLGPQSRWGAIEVVSETGSTNKDLADRADEASDGSVLIAEHQTRGRGRYDRTWTAPPGSSVAISVLIRPKREFADWTWLPLIAGLAVLRGVRDSAAHGKPHAEALALKWPNDVLINLPQGEGGGKLCGILAERAGTSEEPVAVIGMGLNISMDESELPVPTATSLALAGFDTDQSAVVAAVLRNLDELLGVWEERGHIREAYSAACSSIGAELSIQISENLQVSGTGAGIDSQGRLQVATGNGVMSFSAGDVVHARLNRS